ncbi:molecular chaperone DnaJ [Merismopedia glauca]|uniref:Molecular chaperone DnaJ n=1 Tax=Merismopedia glauca CCAP 1448/3 TaxID=1296344 RepID=A0A2T1C6M3_9CYAN|nr:molecular chaperone DnaJ [Merismopedia glauca]PSB03787.1 molecular chaperone DnaJ [Merismopedia glauca CCAP 1448/3]
MNHQLDVNNLLCHHCEGKGYIEIRDCSGEIQCSQTCWFCHGTGICNDSNDGDD